METEHDDVYSAGLDDGEQKESENYIHGLEEGGGSESEVFEFEG